MSLLHFFTFSFMRYCREIYITPKDHLESESDSQIFVVNRLMAPVVKYYFNKLFPIKPIPTVLFQ